LRGSAWLSLLAWPRPSAEERVTCRIGERRARLPSPPARRPARSSALAFTRYGWSRRGRAGDRPPDRAVTGLDSAAACSGTSCSGPWLLEAPVVRELTHRTQPAFEWAVRAFLF
jgi:hypothetical protein